jgi:hypothetical protein
LHREQRSFDVGVEELVKMLLCDFAEGRKLSNAGVGENDIDSSPRLDGLRDGVQMALASA